MEWQDELTLIAETAAENRVNKNGFAVKPEESARTVFCNKKTVGYSEYFKSQQTGKLVEAKYEVHKADYGGEDVVEVNGRRYFVLKTYDTGTDTIGALTTKAIEGYAAQEQLVGGVETLFKTSSDTVVGYANDAYKTAGMSANEYMETVTSFSASLLASMNNDTAAAAEKANVAITDMSDNANKMGTDISLIQNAYNGFAKQNYTMLDNLKLGYGGTKEEMQRLLDDASKLSGIKYDISSYSDVVDAIHVVQTEMGITGTTAKEASTTIEGSVSSMSSAWDNWVAGMADSEANFSQLTSNLVDSIVTVVGNIAPRVIETVPRLVSGLGEIVEQLATYIPQVIQELLPPLMSGVQDLLNTLVGMLPEMISIIGQIIPTIIDTLLTILPQLLEAGVQIITELAQGIAQALPTLLPTIVTVVTNIVTMLIENIPLLITAALQLLTGLAQGLVAALPVLIEALPEIITAIINALVEGIPLIIESAGDIIVALIDGIIDAIPLLIAAIPQIIAAIVTGLITGLPKILTAAGKLVMTIINKIKELPTLIPQAIAAGVEKIAEWGANMQEKGGTVITGFVTKVIDIVKELPQKIWNSIVGAVTRVATWGNNMLTKAKEVMNAMVTGVVTIVKELPQKIWNSISGAISKVATWGTEVKNKAVEGMRNVITGIADVFKDIGSTLAGFGKNMVEGIWNGISGATRWIKDKISGWVGNVTDFLKDLFGIASPSKLMRDEIGVYLAQGIGVGFSNEIGGVKKMIEDSVPQEFDVDAKVNVGNEFKYDNDDKKPKPRGGGSAAGGVVVNQYIYANTTDYAKQQKEAARQFRMIARTV